jgi:60 kDa SS-A/Ro ribonucleoprotein
MTALVRNLGKMSAVGLLKPLSPAVKEVTQRLQNQEYLRRGRIHPMAVLTAMRVYQSGHGIKGSLSWSPVSQIVDALDSAFYLTFGNVEPTGKNWLLAIDVSGSMQNHQIAGVAGLTCREAAAALALVTAATEPNHHIVGFYSGSGSRTPLRSMNQALSGIQPLDISPKMRLTDVIAKVSRADFGGTDCSLPMLYADAQKLAVDAFVVYTDNETWAGTIQPVQALNNYRKNQNRPEAKEIVVGMVANKFTIADPNDSGMLDVVGFDTSVPAVMSEFVGSSKRPTPLGIDEIQRGTGTRRVQTEELVEA